MKISELIQKLQEIQKEHGDLQVKVIIDGFDVSLRDMTFTANGNTLFIE